MKSVAFIWAFEKEFTDGWVMRGLLSVKAFSVGAFKLQSFAQYGVEWNACANQSDSAVLAPHIIANDPLESFQRAFRSRSI